MALCPFAEHKLIPPGSSDPAIDARAAVLHVDAGGALSLFSYFRDRSGGIESHFHIRWDGVIEQYRDTAFQADANYQANDFAVSIETQGFGNGTWNKRQLASIQRLLLWLSEEHNIPLAKILSPFGSGVGYHVQFGSPGPWTPVAKSCPGPNRIKQYEEILVPWMVKMSKPEPRPRLKIITANLWRENKEVVADLDQLRKERAHIIALNEAANHLDAILQVKGYQAVYGRASNLERAPKIELQNPVLVRNGIEVLDQGRLLISKGVNRSPERAAVWFTYEYAGEKRAHINTHFNSHVQAGARVPHNLPRVGEYVRGVRKVKRLVRALQAQGYRVTVSGDMNWSFTKSKTQWLFSPKSQFKKVGLRAQFAYKNEPDRPKGDGRRIEYIFADPDDLLAAEQHFVKPEHSDHPFHCVHYIVRGK